MAEDIFLEASAAVPIRLVDAVPALLLVAASAADILAGIRLAAGIS